MDDLIRHSDVLNKFGVLDSCSGCSANYDDQHVERCKPVDVVEVVRCKDCKYAVTKMDCHDMVLCGYTGRMKSKDGFCDDGSVKRKDDTK